MASCEVNPAYCLTFAGIGASNVAFGVNEVLVGTQKVFSDTKYKEKTGLARYKGLEKDQLNEVKEYNTLLNVVGDEKLYNLLNIASVEALPYANLVIKTYQPYVLAKKEISKNSQGTNTSNLTVKQKEIETGKKLSDNTENNINLVVENKIVEIDGEILEVKPNINYDHVIGGDSRKSRVSGGHSLLKGDVKIKNITKLVDKNGVYEAKIEILNKKTGEWQLKKGKTTMFPREWSEHRIREEINSAWNSKEFKIIPIKDRGNMWSGMSKSGIEIEGYVNPNGITAYPIYEGGK